MKRDKYAMLAVVVVLVGVFVGAASWYRSREKAKATSLASANAEALVRPYSPTLGPADAKVTLVEFFDPECEACRAIYPAVKTVMKEFEGKVRLVLRYMPFHKNSVYAAGVLEAARKQGKYWEALEIVFDRQAEWASHDAPKPELLVGYLQPLGLDLEQLTSSARDPEAKSKVQQDQQDGTRLGVKGTPTFFVNGKPLARLGIDEMRAAINEALKQ